MVNLLLQAVRRSDRPLFLRSGGVAERTRRRAGSPCVGFGIRRHSRATRIRRSPASCKGPDVDIYAIDVSFAALKDKAEFDYLNELPTSFVLPDEAVDRLRAAAGTIIIDSPEFQRLLKEVGATIAPEGSPPGTGSSRAPDAVPTAR